VVTVRTTVDRGDGGSAELGGRTLLLEVADTGVGMGEALLRRIFDPFFTTKKQGTGLGLSTCYGVVRAFGGEMSVRSQLGEGTTFRCRFPIIEASFLELGSGVAVANQAGPGQLAVAGGPEGGGLHLADDRDAGS
jgi:signal transduction histidine kinase